MILRPTRPRLLIPRRKVLLGLGAAIAMPYVARAGSLSLLGAGKPPAGGGGGGSNPFTLIAHAAAGSPNQGLSQTSTINTTGANLIVGGAVAFNTSNNFQDSASNTWTACTLYSAGGCVAQLFYCYNPTTSASHYFVNNFGVGTYTSVFAAAFSGSAASPFDQQNGFGTASAVTSIQPGSVTPTLSNELVVSLVLAHVGSAFSVDSGFTITDSVASDGNHVGGSMAYLKQTTAAAVNPTWSYTEGTTVANIAAIATFK